MTDANKLVRAYIKIRTAKEVMAKRHEDEIESLNVDLEMVSQALLEVCKETGQDGGRTDSGSFSRTVKTRYWTTDWASFYNLVRELDSPQLLEQRVHQGNFKEFLKGNPGRMPAGMNVDSKYAITVTRPRAKL